jgi:hypothetical protein
MGRWTYAIAGAVPPRVATNEGADWDSLPVPAQGLPLGLLSDTARDRGAAVDSQSEMAATVVF